MLIHDDSAYMKRCRLHQRQSTMTPLFINVQNSRHPWKRRAYVPDELSLDIPSNQSCMERPAIMRFIRTEKEPALCSFIVFSSTMTSLSTPYETALCCVGWAYVEGLGLYDWLRFIKKSKRGCILSCEFLFLGAILPGSRQNERIKSMSYANSPQLCVSISSNNTSCAEPCLNQTL